jgi:hypothetical protein
VRDLPYYNSFARLIWAWRWHQGIPELITGIPRG